MFTLLVTAFGLTLLTIVVHAIGTSSWLNYLTKHVLLDSARRGLPFQIGILTATAAVMMALHIIEILMWALTYRVIAPDELPSLEAAFYFSSVTFTTLGYGDVTLSDTYRSLSGLEAINGIVLVGWTTAFLFAVLQRIWTGKQARH